MWSRIFDLLLNTGEYNQRLLDSNIEPSELSVPEYLRSEECDYDFLQCDFPLLGEIVSAREELESWLKANCSKGGKSLRVLIGKLSNQQK